MPASSEEFSDIEETEHIFDATSDEADDSESDDDKPKRPFRGANKKQNVKPSHPAKAPVRKKRPAAPKKRTAAAKKSVASSKKAKKNADEDKQPAMKWNAKLLSVLLNVRYKTQSIVNKFALQQTNTQLTKDNCKLNIIVFHIDL